MSVENRIAISLFTSARNYIELDSKAQHMCSYYSISQSLPRQIAAIAVYCSTCAKHQVVIATVMDGHRNRG